ncbi:MAG TPA: LLM class F420-dependent oxidoreductase [Ktedonosporobacter sp.]|nr:LLM class F420-dependent oxidoreductase [Ktedonosporobacter sp.]
MKFGLFAINMYACSYPETALQVAQLAEEAGFESLWAGEHVVLPDPQVPPASMAPQDRILDPVIALTFLAAHTKQVRLGTGIIILPQRNPLVLAKELASLDELSGGRLIFGIGAGYLEPEFGALGIPFADRGMRTDEYLAVMQTIWTQPKPEYHGRFVSFTKVQAHPHPQRNIPVVVGGGSPPAYRRAVESASGWYGFNLDINWTAHALAEIRKASQHTTRPQELGDLEISVTPREPLTLEVVKQYTDLGVHRLILMPLHRMPVPSRSASAIKEYVKRVGDTFIGHT